VAANLAVAPAIAPITVLGSAAAALCVLWPAGAQFLIRFTGPELWWVLGAARWAAGVPMATVAVPPGVPGVLAVGGGTVLVALLALLLRRLRWFRRWFRRSMRWVATACGLCLLALFLSEFLSGLVGPS